MSDKAQKEYLAPQIQNSVFNHVVQHLYGTAEAKYTKPPTPVQPLHRAPTSNNLHVNTTLKDVTAKYRALSHHDLPIRRIT